MPTTQTYINLLALDTSTPACSVALCCHGRNYSRGILASRTHTQHILPMVDEVLDEAGVSLQDIDGLAFTVGPGSFTGIRIGFGVAQGLAFGAELPVAAISTLETMAVGAVENFSIAAGCYIMPMLDARMEEVYWALFRVGDNLALERITEDRLSAPGEVEVCLPTGAELVVVGDGCNYEASFSFTPQQMHAEYLPDAKAMLEIAHRIFQAGEAQDIAEVQPVYLRDKITWKKRQRLRE